MKTGTTSKAAGMEKSIRQKLRVDFEFPVLFGRGIFQKENSMLADALNRLGEKERHRVFVIMDRGAGNVEAVKNYVEDHADCLEWAGEPFVLAGGESLKNGLPSVMRMVDALAEAKLCRHSFVLAIGGGALLDAAGLATALVHRGLRLVRIPTTVLSQCDSGVGVKNGINYAGQKNFLGTFVPPFAVLNDFDFLRTLPQESWIAGVSEAFKVAIIKDAGFFRFLCGAAKSLAARDEVLMEKVIIRCAELHLDHIRNGGDPFEAGTARPLDFGHWSAHELERMTDWKLGHGQAVAIGLALDSLYACRKGWLEEEQLAQVRQGLKDCGFALGHSAMLRRDPSGNLALMRGLETFREHLGGELSITFPKGIGHGFEAHEIDGALMERCLLEAELS